MATLFKIPQDASKPTNWIKSLELKEQKKELIAQLRQQIDAKQGYGKFVPYQTKNVKKSTIKRFKKWLKPLTDLSPQKLNIIPVGGICLCHQNVDIAIQMLTDLKYMGLCPYTFRWAIGYNLMSCPCGGELYAEVHSVLHCVEKNEYYDITEDMYGETEKWFVECPSMTENYFHIAQDLGIKKYDILTSNGCNKCNFTKVGDENCYTGNNLDIVQRLFK
tara:strand:+ start:85 stop:741 length:657 start_codon:yes stop_codon:yes gene_type:complete